MPGLPEKLQTSLDAVAGELSRTGIVSEIDQAIKSITALRKIAVDLHGERRTFRRRIRTLMQPRDESGWRIPRAGTVSRALYDMLREGKTASEMKAAHPQVARNTINQLVWIIKNPDRANALGLRSYRARFPFSQPHSLSEK